jgi:very-short-patch-repair endonuclease
LPSQIQSKIGKFCNKKCYSEWQRKSDYNRGKNNPNYKEYKIKCQNCGEIKLFHSKKCNSGKRKFCSQECSNKFFSKNRLGENNPNYKEKVRKICETCKKPFLIYPSKMARRKFCSWECWLIYLKNIRKITDLNREKMLKSLLKRPTKPEIEIKNLIEKNNLPYKYVGNGSFIIGGINPDFIECNGKKLIIEVFGNYWHREGATKFRQTEYGRRKIYEKYGYKMLVLWENEIYEDKNKILEKIKNFMEENNMDEHTDHSNWHKEQAIKNGIALEDHLRGQNCPECMTNNQ